MRWDVAPRLRCDIVAFDGLNLSGERRVVEVHPVAGRKGDLTPENVRSMAFVGELGTRIVFMTSDEPDRWEASPWRAFVLQAGGAFRTKEGRPCVRAPDLDWLDAPDARRSDTELQSSFDEVERLEDGTGWTFGRPGVLKGRIRAIRIDRVVG